MQFEDLDLNYDILDALDDMNFTECTPIQEHAIPPILEGRDIIGVAQTGTGKTAAYLLPILSLLRDGDYPTDAINCVIMAPTRELAQQIDQAMQGFAYYLDGISSVAIYGGNDGIRYEQEKRGLTLGADVIICTPGRLISHLSLGNVDLSRTSFFVLDEADRMLDMGFSEDIMQIACFLPKERQTIMFSATMPDKIVELAKTILTDPVQVKLAVSKPADGIRQSAFICYEAQKLRIVEHLLGPSPKAPSPKHKDIEGNQSQAANLPQTEQVSTLPPEGEQGGGLSRVIVFVGSKMKVKDVAIALKRKGYNAEAMHSDLLQEQRDDVMWRFKTGQLDILVATDIVARGIDIDDIQLVINYDVPRDEEDYVHRIGRTARAGKEGRSVTLVSEKDQPLFRDIENFLEKEVPKEEVPAEFGEAPAYTGRSSSRSSRSRSSRSRSRSRSRSSGSKDGNNRKKGKNTPQAATPATPATAATGSVPVGSADGESPSQKKKRPRHRGGRNRNHRGNSPTPPPTDNTTN